MTDPDHRHVLVIGGQRCGTTWLASVLSTHPDIRSTTSTRPEPKFFLDQDDHARYDELFPASGGGWYLDKSTTYLERSTAAQRAHACVPDAVAIAVLRDPIERVHSNWRFSVAHGVESLSFEDSLTDEAQQREAPGLSTSPFASLRRSRYTELLEPWAAEFGTSLLVLQYERMLGPRGEEYLAERLSQVGMTIPVGWPVRSPKMNEAPAAEPPGTEVRARLREYYRADCERLADDFGIDLALWDA